MDKKQLNRIEEKCDLILIGIAELKAMLNSQPKELRKAIRRLNREARNMQRVAERSLRATRR